MKDINNYSGRVFSFRDIGEDEVINELAVPGFLDINARNYRVEFSRHLLEDFENSDDELIENERRAIILKGPRTDLETENFWTAFNKNALDMAIKHALPDGLKNRDIALITAAYEVRQFNLARIERFLGVVLRKLDNNFILRFQLNGTAFDDAIIEYPKLLNYTNAAWKLGRAAKKKLKNYKKP